MYVCAARGLHLLLPCLLARCGVRGLVRLGPGALRRAAYEVWYNKDESHYRVCNAFGEDPHCSDKYILVRVLEACMRVSTIKQSIDQL